MFDIGWPEMAVVAVIALIIIGPKDLPRIMRTVGRWAGKARGMARQFQRSIDDMARESEIDEVRKGVDSVGKFNPTRELENSIDPTGSVKKALDPTVADDAGEAKPADGAPAATAGSPAETPDSAGNEADTAAEAPKSQASA